MHPFPDFDSKSSSDDVNFEEKYFKDVVDKELLLDGLVSTSEIDEDDHVSSDNWSVSDGNSLDRWWSLENAPILKEEKINDIPDELYEVETLHYDVPQLHRPISPTTVSLPLLFTVEATKKNTNDGTFFYDSPALKKYSWFHGYMTRISAEKLLQGTVNGTFLVRESGSYPGEYVISLYCYGYIHYRIKNENETRYFLNTHSSFVSISELINHHSKSPDGLKTSLQYPVPRTEDPTLRPIEPSSSYTVTNEVDEWELNRSELQMNNKLGGGQYGDVYEAVMKNNGEKVAVKVFKVRNNSIWLLNDVLS